MQNIFGFPLLRRLLLPYRMGEALSYRQGLRVVLTWALFFGLMMSLCSMPLALLVLGIANIQKIGLFFLLAFLSGLIIFGGLAWVVVLLSNRTAQIIQQRKQTTNTSGGRYGP